MSAPISDIFPSDYRHNSLPAPFSFSCNLNAKGFYLPPVGAPILLTYKDLFLAP
ncbi:hypothetical protein BC826DRAFT_1053058, partial [Russula brevipes]